MSIEHKYPGNDALNEQAVSKLLADWYEGESAYQFTRITPEDSQQRLHETVLLSPDGFGGDAAQRFHRYRQFTDGGPEAYPQALQALMKAANATRSLYIAMLLEDGVQFDEANKSTLDLIREHGTDIFDSVAPKQADYKDFFDTSAGHGLVYLAQSLSEEGILPTTVREKQLSLARGVFTDMTGLAMHRIIEAQKETGQLLLPKPGLPSGDINLAW